MKLQLPIIMGEFTNMFIERGQIQTIFCMTLYIKHPNGKTDLCQQNSGWCCLQIGSDGEWGVRDSKGRFAGNILFFICHLRVRDYKYTKRQFPLQRLSITSLFRCTFYFFHKSILLLLLLSRFSHVRLCDPIDGSPSGSSVPGILQARTLEWVATSFSMHFLGAG